MASHAIDWSHRKTTLGYWLGQEFSGQKLMFRCCLRLLEYLFEEVQLHRIGIHCASENHRSRRIAEQLGFRHKGTLRDNEWLYDHFVDQAIYGMLASEFRSLNRTKPHHTTMNKPHVSS